MANANQSPSPNSAHRYPQPRPQPSLAPLAEQILALRYASPHKRHRLCLQLRRQAQALSDSYSLCFAETYLCDCLLSLGAKQRPLLRQLKRAAACCDADGFDELLMHTLNLYGITLGRAGEFSQAADFYIRGLARAEHLHNNEAIAEINANLCDTFMHLKQYKVALPYCRKSLSAARRMKQGPRKEQFIIISTLNLSETYMALGRAEEALALLNGFSPYVGGQLVASFDTALRCDRCYVLHKLGRDEESLCIMDTLIHHAEVDYDASETFFYSIYKTLCVALDMKDEPHSRQLLSILSGSDYARYSPQRQCEYMEASITYCELFGDKGDLLPMYRQLVQLQHLAAEHSAVQRAASLADKIDAAHIREENRIIQQQNEKLQQLSSLDDLTQIANRRTMNEQLNARLAQAVATRTRFGVAMLDIDCFKGYNDAYGHAVGDELIERVAQSLRIPSMRFFPTRFGGDEFVVLCSNCSNEEIAAYLTRVQVTFIDLQHDLQSVRQRVTLSIGYCNGIPSAAITPAALLQAADHALYTAKNQRGSIVCHALPSAEL